MKLGLVTYNLARDWDLDTLVERCGAHGFEAVELRTGHAHGVETTLSPEERLRVRAKFAAGPVALEGLGSAFEFHSDDPAEVRRNIDGTVESLQLAADLGAPGVKVRPNGLHRDKGIPEERTLDQIGDALAECAAAGEKLGVCVRLEVHGPETSEPARIRRIMDRAAHPFARVCWNCTPPDVIDGSVAKNFALLQDHIDLVHMRDLSERDYPWVELFCLLQSVNYQGACLAEIPSSPEPERLMAYYRAIWDAYQEMAHWKTTIPF